MKLNFLGRGAAFFPEEGNTSAYFIDNNELFLIDCGESVYNKLVERELLKSINSINVMITHTHSDHIGSLGTLIMHSYFKLKKELNIILPENAKHLSNIKNYLTAVGCTEEMYKLVKETDFDKKYKTFQKTRYIETTHCDELKSYSLIFKTPEGIVFYSGDSNQEQLIKRIIRIPNYGIPLNKLYIDTTSANYPGNVHLYIGTLKEIIPEDLKHLVYCMHFNNAESIDIAKKIGFQVVEVEPVPVKVQESTDENIHI